MTCARDDGVALEEQEREEEEEEEDSRRRKRRRKPILCVSIVILGAVSYTHLTLPTNHPV